MFAVSFKLLAIEYLLDVPIADLLDSASRLPDDFWGISANDLEDFDGFCKKVSEKMEGLIKKNIDSRKQKLFELIYSSKGSLSVKELSEQVYWSSRQINRYFNKQYGISLKAYCNILRFRASLQQIKDGKLFPEQNFTDQAHFIKEIKKYSGVIPKELRQNKNDRFILFSTLVNMAMLDALELSECLTSNAFNDLRSSIAAYEDQMRARNREAARESLENTEWMHAEKAMARMVGMFEQ